jgi:hypothetical protein
MEAGAPGDEPQGNCETKCCSWLKRCNNDPLVNALEVLGDVIQPYMDREPVTPLFGDTPPERESGQLRILAALARNQLAYRTNGLITAAGSNQISKTLEDYLRSGDFSSIEVEFARAIENINTDPHASVTAACAIIEATLKFYIEKFRLVMPSKLNVILLWAVVTAHLKLNSDPLLASDQQKIFKGISSIIDGVGAFRSHIGSAHGRGSNPPKISVAEAKLVVNVGHTVVTFIMEQIHAQKT